MKKKFLLSFYRERQAMMESILIIITVTSALEITLLIYSGIWKKRINRETPAALRPLPLSLTKERGSFYKNCLFTKFQVLLSLLALITVLTLTSSFENQNDTLDGIISLVHWELTEFKIPYPKLLWNRAFSGSFRKLPSHGRCLNIIKIGSDSRSNQFILQKDTQ